MMISVQVMSLMMGLLSCVMLLNSWISIGHYKTHAPISSILIKPRDMNSLTLL